MPIFGSIRDALGIHKDNVEIDKAEPEIGKLEVEERARHVVTPGTPEWKQRMTNNEKLIEHLSKEIETLTNNVMTFRTRCNFAVFVGPFVLLGSILIAAKGIPHGLSIDRWTKASGLGLFLSYITMGWACASIEAHSWKQCNTWRRLIVRIASNPNTKIGENELEFDESLWTGYMIVYIAMIVAFVCVICIISKVTIIVSP